MNTIPKFVPQGHFEKQDISGDYIPASVMDVQTMQRERALSRSRKSIMSQLMSIFK